MAKTKAARQRKKYKYSANRRKMWKKQKRLPNIECDPIKTAWDNKKSVKENLRAMGLSSDPNKTLPIPTTKERLAPVSLDDSMDFDDKLARPKGKQQVIKELEAMADMPTKKREKISEPMMMYCAHMMDKYGTDFKAMARDIKNYYQDTPKQIKKKIALFKTCKVQYQEYLAQKAGEDGQPDTEDVTMS
ncbi:nucleolar protein 16 [Strongylocentrotus purpuratus]|uniref:Nucleolar protein 16 n=1 Tax=Strongylocentrotus purpuratus TaxID=7668 RepID=A0A7M7NTL2_STRPU|nr:nucleolar protein 16 [Strongylocentrotus purpuratus]